MLTDTLYIYLFRFTAVGMKILEKALAWKAQAAAMMAIGGPSPDPDDKDDDDDGSLTKKRKVD